MNCARIYNTALANPYAYIANNPRAYSGVIRKYEKHPTSWQTTFEMPDKHVTNGFFLYSLLLDRAERGLILQLQHDEASQKDRLQPALHGRNKLMEGIGQELYTHACDLCFVVFNDGAGKISTSQNTAQIGSVLNIFK